jgi:hypothetical protein
MSEYDGAIGTVTSLLSHYLKTVFLAAGLNWNSDNDAETKSLIEAIVAEANKEKG